MGEKTIFNLVFINFLLTFSFICTKSIKSGGLNSIGSSSEKEENRPFECFTCNADDGDNANYMKECVEKIEVCSEGVQSCSTVIFYATEKHEQVNNVTGIIFEPKRLRYVRKFCTSVGIQTNLQEPSCQNINSPSDFDISSEQHSVETQNTESDFVVPDNTFNIEPMEQLHPDNNTSRTKRMVTNGERGSPAPPYQYNSITLCTCNQSLCNFEDVTRERALKNVETPSKDLKFQIKKTKGHYRGR